MPPQVPCFPSAAARRRCPICMPWRNLAPLLAFPLLRRVTSHRIPQSATRHADRERHGKMRASPVPLPHPASSTRPVGGAGASPMRSIGFLALRRPPAEVRCTPGRHARRRAAAEVLENPHRDGAECSPPSARPIGSRRAGSLALGSHPPCRGGGRCVVSDRVAACASAARARRSGWPTRRSVRSDDLEEHLAEHRSVISRCTSAPVTRQLFAKSTLGKAGNSLSYRITQHRSGIGFARVSHRGHRGHRGFPPCPVWPL
jgi:hypothetical protein